MSSLPSFLTDPDPYVYVNGKHVTLDFETTNLRKGSALDENNRLLLAVWKCSWKEGLRVVHGSEFDMQLLLDDIAEADFIVAHNAKFELQWLDRCGLELHDVLVFDTMLAGYVLGGNRKKMQHLSLDRMAAERLGEKKTEVVSKLIKSGAPVEDIPVSWLEKYCRMDVELTHRLYVSLIEELFNEELLPVMYTRCLLTPALADIEKNGMYLDSEKVLPMLEEKEREFDELAEQLSRMTGGVNLASPKQFGVYLYETLKIPQPKGRDGQPLRTPSGGYPTDSDTVLSLNPRNKKQRTFLDAYTRYRSLYSELTKYLRKFGACCRERGGHLLAKFNQAATFTHRLSSSGEEYSTQFQNLPRIYKPLFRARKDNWGVYESDGSQLEFRVAVHLGRDSRGLSHIREGVDIHSNTAEVIGCSRQDAKAHTFKPLYGGSSGTPDEQRYYRHFKEVYTGIAAAQDRWKNTVLKDKKLRTECGLTFYWPDTKMQRSGYITNTTSICNYPVQSLATAEIIPVALVYMWHRIHADGLPFLLVNTIHDSIIAEGPTDAASVKQWHELSRTCLIDDVYEYMQNVYNMHLTVPLGCSVAHGSHWGSKDETKYEAPAELYV